MLTLMEGADTQTQYSLLLHMNVLAHRAEGIFSLFLFFICLFVYLFICLFVYLFLCLFVYLLISFFFCLLTK